MRVSGDPAAPLIVMWPQFAAVGERVKRIGAEAVPSASKRPPFAILIPSPESSCTVVPGSMMRVTPLSIVTLPQMTIGLFVARQVVSTLMGPLRQLGLLVIRNKSAI